MIRLTHTAAQALMLAAQGLAQPSDAPASKADVVAVIRRMGALQIDTIHVVARSPYLVLWSRLGAYEPRWLDELLAEGALFEYWAHAACFLPIEDYPLYRRRMLDRGEALNGVQHWLAQHPHAAEHVLTRIRDGGPVRSADFERTDGEKSGWWNWKPEKMALERLFDIGALMVARRHNFQRVYDLRERVLPGWDDADTAPTDAMRDALTVKAVRALGVTTAAWVPDYFRMLKQGMAERLDRLADAGVLARAEVEGWDGPAFVHPDHQPAAEAAASGALMPTLTTLLSPFDPLVWDRARAKAVFDFDYRIECYTPADKRRYGYFSLPILRRGRLIGRLDAKAHRRAGVFEVKALHLEPGVDVSDDLAADVAGALRACAAWHGAPQVVVRQSDPPQVAAALTAYLNKEDV